MPYQQNKAKIFGVIALIAPVFFFVSKVAADASGLYRASQKGDIEKVQMLIDKGADVNERATLSGSFAINAAAAENNIELLRLLVDSGANVNVQSWGGGDTALICATKYGGGKEHTVK